MNKITLRSCGASLLSLALAAPAMAQDGPPAPPAAAVPDNSGAPGDIIVTAQRRATSIQKVPVSIAAFGGAQLAQAGILTPDQLLSRVPATYFVPAVNKNFTQIGIRGFSSLVKSPAADLPVAFFVDDVYYSGAADLNLYLYDVDRVEVLRGPQGTLFGRNVVGGAISIFSVKPQFEDHASVKFEYGNFNQINTEGFVNGVIVPDKVAARLSFSTRRSDGLYKNENRPDDRVANDKVGSARAQFLIRPTSTLNILLSGNYTSDSGRGNPAKITGYNGPNPTPLTLIPASSPDPFTVDFSEDTPYSRKLGGVLGRVDWDVAGGTLTSITAWRKNKTFAERDVDTTSLFIRHDREAVDNVDFSQEVRFASDASKRLSFVAGFFYLNSDHTVNHTYMFGTPAAGTVIAPLVPRPTTDVTNMAAKIRDYAGFAEATFKITNRLSLIAGTRYTVDKKYGLTTVVGDRNPLIFADPLPVSAPFGKTFKSWTPRGIIRWEPTDDINLYATVAKGFKGGGFTYQLTTIAGITTPFNPEKATNYEVGIKSKFFDRRVTFNATLFREIVDDLQVNSYNAFLQPITANAGKVRSQGAEIETSWQVTRAFNVYANYAYLDAKYLKYLVPGLNYQGNTLPYAPRNSIAVGGLYTVTLPNRGKVTFTMDYSHRSRMRLLDANNAPSALTKQTISDLTNGRIEYRTPDDRWEFAIWGQNIFNEKVLQAAYDLTAYAVSSAQQASGTRAYYEYYNIPRTFGGSVRFNF